MRNISLIKLKIPDALIDTILSGIRQWELSMLDLSQVIKASNYGRATLIDTLLIRALSDQTRRFCWDQLLTGRKGEHGWVAFMASPKQRPPRDAVVCAAHLISFFCGNIHVPHGPS